MTVALTVSIKLISFYHLLCVMQHSRTIPCECVWYEWELLNSFQSESKLIFVAASSGQTVLNCNMILAKLGDKNNDLLVATHVQSQQYDTVRHCYLFSISLYLWFILAQRSQLLNRRIESCIHLVI